MRRLFEGLAETAVDGGPARFCMPGHKGNPDALDFMHNAVRYDLTETDGTGDLFEAEGMFADSMCRAAGITGAEAVLYSAGGSTLGIQAMLGGFLSPDSTLLLCRDCHTAAINAALTLGIEIKWAAPSRGFGCRADDIVKNLDGVNAVLVTSPDYYGRCADIPYIARECKKRGAALLVDSAHGAHFPLIGLDYPTSQGADAAVISLHKTLPSLTGAAAVLLADRRNTDRVRRMQRLFGSTSPSYLISLSVERGFEELVSGAEKWSKTAALCRQIRTSHPNILENDDPTRIAVPLESGRIADAVSAARRRGVLAEYIGECAVFLCSPYNSERDYERLEALLCELDAMFAPLATEPAFELPERAMSPRQAFFSQSERIEIEKCVGRVASGNLCPCPPCRVIASAGEVIGPQQSEILKNYGILQAYVVKF